MPLEYGPCMCGSGQEARAERVIAEAYQYREKYWAALRQAASLADLLREIIDYGVNIPGLTANIRDALAAYEEARPTSHPVTAEPSEGYPSP